VFDPYSSAIFVAAHPVISDKVKANKIILDIFTFN
jgi:hypothetical protein